MNNGKPENGTPWRTVPEAAARGRVGPKTIYREIKAGRLRAAVIGNRRDYRIHESWVDEWLTASAEPVEWVTFDRDTLRATVQGLPGPSDISLPVDVNIVIEFMSR